jgi:hypothetical protein
MTIVFLCGQLGWGFALSHSLRHLILDITSALVLIASPLCAALLRLARSFWSVSIMVLLSLSIKSL